MHFPILARPIRVERKTATSIYHKLKNIILFANIYSGVLQTDISEKERSQEAFKNMLNNCNGYIAIKEFHPDIAYN